MVSPLNKENLPNTLELYDEALLQKLKKLYTNVIGTFPDRAMFESNNKSKVSLPLISMYRLQNDINFSGGISHPAVFRGYRTGDEQRTRVIDIDLLYTIDIWADKRNEADQLFYDLVYILWTKPNITLDMEGTENDKLFSLRLVEQSSSSNLFEQSVENNRIYRYTLTYSVNEAKLMYRVPDGMITDVDTEVDSY